MDPTPLASTSLSSPLKGTSAASPPKITKDGIIEFADGRQFRIKEVKIGDQIINFENLQKNNQEFKQLVENQVVRSFTHNPHIDETANDNGLYNLSLIKEIEKLKNTALNPQHLQELEEGIENLHHQGTKIIQESNLKKHTFTAHIPSNLQTTCIKASAVAFAILTSPIWIPLAGLIYTGSAIHRAIKKTTITDAAESMQIAQEKAKWEAIDKVYESEIRKTKNIIQDSRFRDKPEAISHELMKKANVALQDKEKVFELKLERSLRRAFQRVGQDFDITTFNALKDVLTPRDLKDFENLRFKLRNIAPEITHILTDADIQEMVEQSKALFDDTIIEDQQKLTNLIEALEIPDSDVRETNVKVLFALREVLNSATYEALKEDPSNNLVKLVQLLSSSYWNNVKALPAYQAFGEEVQQNLNAFNALQPGEVITGPKMKEILTESHHHLEKELFTDHGIPAKILYAVNNPLQALDSMSSEGGVLRAVSTAFGRGVYDPHGINNNPSIQGATNAQIRLNQRNIDVTVNNCYGGSPTIGDENKTVISPEYLAMCQAAENNQFAKVKDKRIPTNIYYTNFQNIENPHGEGERSFAIMQLNDRFPLSFTGMTLAKDSKFYMMKEEYKDPIWTDAASFGKEMLEVFANEKTYQYGSRTIETKDMNGKYIGGNGIFLPGGANKWKPVLESIIETANDRFEAIPNQHLINPRELRGAYQEYVYSMIQAYTEMEIAREYAEKTGDTTPLITATRACKENIDRGGAENAKYLHTRFSSSASNEERVSTVIGALECRALSVRKRIILGARLPQVFAFIEHVEKDDFNADLDKLYRQQGLAFNRTPTYSL
jgi:hypothetical protein